MSTEIDYVLGTHDEEIQRLGLQHRVWQARVLDAWARAGINQGSRVVDFGCGPGFATLDAASIVGPQGQVTAIERSAHFLSFARKQVDAQALSWVRFLQADLDADELPLQGFDLAWCRWVASFVASPEKLINRIAASLRIGGKAVLHEYQNYASWQVIPHSETFCKFVEEVMASWRAAGGEPDIVNKLIPLLEPAGLNVVSLRPHIFVVGPSHFTWRWPASFLGSGSRRLVELKRISPDYAQRIQADFRALEKNPAALMVTPLVVEIIAEKSAAQHRR
ncbi:MAG TPA: methyltransferase domain-containing protein [Steroidobacteraceae bacterium]